MKYVLKVPSRFTALATAAFVLGLNWTTGGADSAPTFASPEEAVAALSAAVNANDSVAVLTLFGPEAAGLINPDPVQAAQEFAACSRFFGEGSRLKSESPDRMVLELGRDPQPFPVPLERQDGRWRFDGAAGKEELTNRRVGRNELATLQTVRTYVEAQREYALRDRDGDEVLEYAQRFTSTPAQKDGLYWSPELDGEISPLGPYYAAAHAEGYRQASSGSDKPQPFHGYLFRILTRQGSHAPGGRHDFIINGHMIAGFGLVAYPAVYGETGVMTFIVNQQGKVYQKDLGPKTSRLAAAMREYNPDSSWSISPD